MKKLISIVLLTFPCISYAFSGSMQFVETTGGFKHVIEIKKWNVNTKNVPSFDYTYTQSKGKCKYEISGRVIAGFDENDGKISLQVYNSQDDKGKEADQVLAFSDDVVNVGVNIALLLKQIKHPKTISIDKSLTDDEFKKICNKNSKEIDVTFSHEVKKYLKLQGDTK